ncbi:MAG: helix-turn-helix domain-containing protein [Thermodesulfovibrionales bacterium]|jgi:hypothetical protein
MAERDILTIKQKELKRLHVIHKVLEGSLTQRQAAEVVSLSERQIPRIVKRIGAEGDKGIQHRSWGKESNRLPPRKFEARVVQFRILSWIVTRAE